MQTYPGMPDRQNYKWPQDAEKGCQTGIHGRLRARRHLVRQQRVYSNGSGIRQKAHSCDMRDPER